MTKRLNLDEIEVSSFVTKGKINTGGAVNRLDDGTIDWCHCPTANCGPSAAIGWTICCL